MRAMQEEKFDWLWKGLKTFGDKGEVGVLYEWPLSCLEGSHNAVMYIQDCAVLSSSSSSLIISLPTVIAFIRNGSWMIYKHVVFLILPFYFTPSISFLPVSTATDAQDL
ncbi:unnamed protein product [Allacma fusca]|uniref:Uncharacterized protein n=1 Tax=Allacma fusca TaxID=39272 RepID=A0A8J2K0M3_9HEXA|nr:unnamed protein product [Allacma fusca]